MMAMCRSVIGGGQIALPLESADNELGKLKAAIPDRKVLLSTPANAKEYS
jgi:hypothetical protein